jgi:hypothetical protein
MKLEEMNPFEIAEEAICKHIFVDTYKGRECKIVPGSIDWEGRTCSLEYIPPNKNFLKDLINFIYIQKYFKAKI